MATLKHQPHYQRKLLANRSILKRGHRVRHRITPEQRCGLQSAAINGQSRVPELTYFGHKIIWGEPGIVEFSTTEDPKKW